MNAIPILESQLYSGYNENLLPEFMMFNEPFTWNVVSGDGTGENLPDYTFQGERSLRVRSTISQGVVISSGGTQTNTPIYSSGIHVLSWRNYRPGTEYPAGVTNKVKIFIDGALTVAEYALAHLSGDVGKWNTYFVLFTAAAGDIVSFEFEASPSTIETATQYLDGFKLEYDKYGIGIPTQFTPPTRTPLPTNPTADGLYAIRVIGGVTSFEEIPE